MHACAPTSCDGGGPSRVRPAHPGTDQTAADVTLGGIILAIR